MNEARAKRFGIFCWIYAALLAMSGIGGILSLAFLLDSLRESSGGRLSFDLLLSEFSQPFSTYHYMFFAFVAYVLIAAALILISIVANIRLGARLRSGILPSGRAIVLTSIVSAVSSVFAGLVLVPFGLALCVYGIWFARVMGPDSTLIRAHIK